METQDVSSAILSIVRADVDEQFLTSAKRALDGASIRVVEREFFESLRRFLVLLPGSSFPGVPDVIPDVHGRPKVEG
jgi:hypothetical protein